MAAADEAVRVGNAQAFWGDRPGAAAELLAREPGLDYLTMDYLAEVSMSILAVQRERDAAAGYARDFVEVVRSLAPYWNAGGRCRLVTNAGGLNPQGCAEACRAALEEAGCRSLRIAVVAGDDVLASMRAGGAWPNLDTGAAIDEVRGRLVTANAYAGADGIARALDRGADLVLTGRVADPSMVVGVCRHHFGWAADDWPRLAGATVAGHLIECGTHVTGGILTDWLAVPDTRSIGFPVVEIDAAGGCTVAKAAGSGGTVTAATVKEQLLYEIGDPARYLSPDCTVSLLGLAVADEGHDRVRVSGAVGGPPPPTLKVSATCRDGWRAAGMLTVLGRDAVAKARRGGQDVIARCPGLRDHRVEVIGSGDAGGGVAGRRDDLTECVLRVAVEADGRDAVERFARELVPLVTSGPQGTTGYAAGRPRVAPVIRYWPCLIDADAVAVQCRTLTTRATDGPASWPTAALPAASGPRPSATPTDYGGRLGAVAYARSGDKGVHANVGVLVRDPDDDPRLRAWLTAERVKAFFGPWGVESVERFEVANLHGLNFLLRGILADGLRTDVQGKALGQLLLEMPLDDAF